MTDRSRDEFLRELGYAEPFDRSPVEVPNGWNGGAVVNTGGNVMCRIWQTWKGNERQRDIEYEVIYDVSQDAGVSLQSYTWDNKSESYRFEELAETRKADEQSDYAQAKIAEQLMEEYSE